MAEIMPEHVRQDAFSRMMQERIGGTVGKHARRAGMWFSAAPWTVLLAIVAWLLCILRQTPCTQTKLDNQPNVFYRMCYTDISTLYQNRQLYLGESPYKMEYPVLTNVMVDIGRNIAHLFGARIGPAIGGMDALNGANLFMAVTGFLLFVCFIVTVLAQVDTVRTRPFDALMVAGAPTLILSGLVNWDMLVVMLAALAVWAWSRNRPALSGVFIGLGIAAKLYPFLLLIPLFALCLRTKKMKEWFITLGATVVAWLVPNGIVFAARPEEWKVFWTFNVDRGSDLGSIYYALSLMKIQMMNVSLTQAILMVVGALGVLAIGLLAPRRPRFGQLAFLMVAWFLMVNKVYSPQYVLWLLPFVVLARPRWNTYIIWTLGEIAYFCAIWGHLAQTLFGATSNGIDRVYIASVFLRLAVQALVAGFVIYEILHPEKDIVRQGGVDDPTGGILDHAPDAGYMGRFLRGRNHELPSGAGHLVTEADIDAGAAVPAQPDATPAAPAEPGKAPLGADASHPVG